MFQIQWHERLCINCLKCVEVCPRDNLTVYRDMPAQAKTNTCTGCGYCLAGCPQNIPIANYLQYYNQKLLFGKDEEDMIKDLDFQYKWQLLAEKQGKASDCVECGVCEEKCTQHLNIIERLKEIADWERKFERNRKHRS